MTWEFKHVPTGVVFYDRQRMLEGVSVGDYGKENNIKADFLGLRKEINGVEHGAINLQEKWVVTVSTQKGCQCNCDFCDVPKLGFHGNLSTDEILDQVWAGLESGQCRDTKRLNVHYARMGEPSYNDYVLSAAIGLRTVVKFARVDAAIIHPVVSTMLPANNPELRQFLREWCDIKNRRQRGEAGLQFSIQSTDEEQRRQMFHGLSLPLEEIADIGRNLQAPIGRKYTLNFALTADSIINADKLKELFSPTRFIVKLTPIHQTHTALSSGYDVGTSYEKFDVYANFEKPLLAAGFDVIVFVPSKEEEDGRITCGNAILSEAAA